LKAAAGRREASSVIGQIVDRVNEKGARKKRDATTQQQIRIIRKRKNIRKEHVRL